MVNSMSAPGTGRGPFFVLVLVKCFLLAFLGAKMGLMLITSWDEASQELLLSIGRPLPASVNTVVSCTAIAARGSNEDAAQHLRCPGAVEHADDSSIALFFLFTM